MFYVRESNHVVYSFQGLISQQQRHGRSGSGQLFRYLVKA